MSKELQERKQRQLMVIWVIEGYKNPDAQANEGHRSSNSLYSTCMRIFILLCALWVTVRALYPVLLFYRLHIPIFFESLILLFT